MIERIFDIYPFNWQAIGTALLCGVMIGLERQLCGKPVGIRTASLIVFGTYIYMATSISVSNGATDPSRVIGQIVTGVGFLGAGVMLTKDGVVLGVTSAATIWALAAIGVCVSIVDPLVTIKLTFVMLFILAGVELLESSSSFLTHGAHRKYNKFFHLDHSKTGGSENGHQDTRSSEDGVRTQSAPNSAKQKKQE